MITAANKEGPATKDIVVIASGLKQLGSNAVTSRYCGTPKIASKKFSKIVYRNGPVSTTKIFSQYMAKKKPIVITKTPIRPLKTESVTA